MMRPGPYLQLFIASLAIAVVVNWKTDPGRLFEARLIAAIIGQAVGLWLVPAIFQKLGKTRGAWIALLVVTVLWMIGTHK